MVPAQCSAPLLGGQSTPAAEAGFHGQILEGMCPSTRAEISPSFLIKQHHSGNRSLQNCLLYLNFYPGSWGDPGVCVKGTDRLGAGI